MAKASPKIDKTCQILVLNGKEHLLKAIYLKQLKDALTKEHGEIDTYNFDGQTAELAPVLDEVRSYSLMGGFKLVIVDNAEQFVKTYRQQLERYADNPVDHAALVLKSIKWNRGNLDKKIAKVGAVVKCEPLKPLDAQKWLTKRATRYNTALSPDVAKFLVERIGTDLGTLDSELGKLAVMAGKNPITQQLIEQAVGKSSEQQAWAAQDAILKSMQQGNSGQAISTIHELIDLSGQPDVMVMYAATDLMRKLAVGTLMKKAGSSEWDITKQLKIWGDSKPLFINLLRRIDFNSASELFSEVLDLDAKAKSGFGDLTQNLEKFCILLSKAHNKNAPSQHQYRR